MAILPSPAQVPLFRFTWFRDGAGYELVPRSSRSASEVLLGASAVLLGAQGWTIRRKAGGALVAYDPDRDVPGSPLHVRFVQIPPTPEGALAFVSEWGFLGSFFGGADAESESVDEILHRRDALARIVDPDAAPGARPTRAEARRKADLFNANVAPHMTIRLEFARTGAPRVVVTPRSLISWMWYRAAQDLVGDTWTQQCERCEAVFVVSNSPRGGQHTQRRRYCSDSCRALASRDRKQTKTKGGTK